MLCCDVISELPLEAELIDAQVEQLVMLAKEHDVDYDGWGTYFEDPNDEDDEELFDAEDDGRRH